MLGKIIKEFIRRVAGGIVSSCSESGLRSILNLQSYCIGKIADRSIQLTTSKPKCSKPVLVAMFEFETSVDRAVNKIANHYYEGKHPKHYLWRSHNDFIVNNVKPGEKVLDIGCGASQYTVRLVEKGANVLGVDINPELVERIKKNNRFDRLRYAVMNINEELPSDEFDTVICSHVLEHLDNPEAFLKRLCKIAPKLIIKVPRVDSGWKKLVKEDLGMFWFDDADHRKEYSWDILVEELKSSGWRPIIKEMGLDLRIVAERIK